MIYGELGLKPLQIDINKRINLTSNKLSNNMLYYMDYKNKEN
jgi:hypothetical protein